MEEFRWSILYLTSGHEFQQTQGDGERQEVWHAAVHGATKSWTQLSNWTTIFSSSFHQKVLKYTEKINFPICLIFVHFPSQTSPLSKVTLVVYYYYYYYSYSYFFFFNSFSTTSGIYKQKLIYFRLFYPTFSFEYNIYSYSE